MRISDWSSDVCSSDLRSAAPQQDSGRAAGRLGGVADGIEPQRDAAGEEELALFRQRVELHAVNVAQQALQPQLAVNAGPARHLQRLLRRGAHGLRGARLGARKSTRLNSSP